MIRRALAPLAILLFVALPVAAWAAPKVAVTAIDGDAEGEVRDAVAEAIEGDEYKLVGKKETAKAVAKIGDVSELSEKDAKKLAKDLSADAIISGSLEKSGATRTLKIKLFANGKMKKGFSVKFKNASSPKFKEAVRKKVAEKLEGVGGGGEAEAEEEAPKKPKKGAKAEAKVEEDEENPLPKGKPKKGEKPEKAEKPEKGEKAEKAAKSEKPKKGEKAEKAEAEPVEKPVSEDEEGAKKPAVSEDEEGAAGKKAAPKKTAAAGDEEGDEEEAVSKRATVKPGGRSPNRAAVRFEVGPSMVKRSLVFNSNLPANQAPRPFRPAVVPGAQFNGELYPLGLSNPDSIAAGLGIGFRYDRTLKMTLKTSAEPNVDIPVDQFQYALGVRLRIVGKSPTSPSVAVGMDLGRSRFKPNRSGLMDGSNLDLPDTYYKFLAPGATFRFPIGSLIAFVLHGEGWLVSDAGAIVRANWYGRAKVLGFDGDAALDVLITRQFALRLGGGFTQIGYQFTGKGGTQANSRDGDPATRDVGGAADRAIHAAATLAVMY